MINWIVGGLVLGFTVYIIATRVRKLSKGENACGGCCSSEQKRKCGGC